MVITAMPGSFAIVRLEPGQEPPSWAWAGSFASVTRTDDELSIVCDEASLPATIHAERGWRALKVAGPMDLSLVGVLASIAAPLAGAGVSLFAVSTFETDYVLVRDRDLVPAIEALRRAGHTVDA